MFWSAYRCRQQAWPRRSAPVWASSAGPSRGSAVDRFGAGRVVVSANLIGAIGDVGLLLAHDILAFAAASAVCALGVRAFWSAFTPLISAIAPVEDREKWFGWLRGARYVGLSLGGALASLALLAGEKTGLRIVVAGDAASYIVAGCLVLATARVPGPARAPTKGRPTPQPGYRAALADRGNLLLALLNVLCTVLATAPLLALPVYVLDQFPKAPWLPGALYATVSSALAVVVSVAYRPTQGRRRLRILAVSGSLWTLGCIAFAAAGPAPLALGLGLLFIAAALLGIAEAVYAPTAGALPLVLAPPGLAGRYTALHQSAWGVSSVISPILASSLLTLTPHAVWLVMGAIAGLTTIASLRVRPALVRRAGVAGTSEPTLPTETPVLLRERPSSAARSASLGSRSPGRRAPDTIISLIFSIG